MRPMTTMTHNGSLLATGMAQGAVAVEALNWPADCGAECSFVGRTRQERHAEMGELLRLEYECYGPMAERLLEAMAKEAAQRWGCRAVRIVHARGRVELGQASVVIQVASPHRSEAFDACRHLIERIKHELPIWKREVWERGETFVHGCCAHSHGHQSKAAPGGADAKPPETRP